MGFCAVVKAAAEALLREPRRVPSVCLFYDPNTALDFFLYLLILHDSFLINMGNVFMELK